MISASHSRSMVVVIRSQFSFFIGIRAHCTRCSTSISCDLMELLVVGSCTDKKDIRDCPYSLTEADF